MITIRAALDALRERPDTLAHYSADPAVAAAAFRPDIGHLLFAPDGRVARDRDNHPLLFFTSADAWSYLAGRDEELAELGMPADKWLVVPFAATDDFDYATHSRQSRSDFLAAVAQQREEAARRAQARIAEMRRLERYTAYLAADAYRWAGGGEAGVDAAHAEIERAEVDRVRVALMALDLIYSADRGRGVAPLSATQYSHNGWHWMEYLPNAERYYGVRV